MLNETAIEKLGLGPFRPNQKVDQFEVAGVLKDFNWSSLQHKIDGLLLSVTADDDSTALWTNKGGCLFAKIGPATNIPALIERIKNIQVKYDAEHPFEYYFMDETFNALYKAEERLAKILISLTVLAIVIACLGLFGLITFMAMQRTREIGIRKTLGASVQNIVKLLSADFVVLVVLAVAVASPLAWYFMNKWLQDFAYRIEIQLVDLFNERCNSRYDRIVDNKRTVHKAATANPAKSLRND